MKINRISPGAALPILFAVFLGSCSLGTNEFLPSAVQPDDQAAVSSREFRDTRTIATSESIPAGWVIIENSGTSYLIRDLNGAPYNWVEEIYWANTNPVGWVTEELRGTSYRVIRNLNGAPSGITWWVHYSSPIPPGWTIFQSRQPGSDFIMILNESTGVIVDRERPSAPVLSGYALRHGIYRDINLSWTPSTDNAGVTKYILYHNGSVYKTFDASTLSWGYYRIKPFGGTHSFYVRAYDAAGNWMASAAYSYSR
jgi:hypothetical protein